MGAYRSKLTFGYLVVPAIIWVPSNPDLYLALNISGFRPTATNIAFVTYILNGRRSQYIENIYYICYVLPCLEIFLVGKYQLMFLFLPSWVVPLSGSITKQSIEKCSAPNTNITRNNVRKHICAKSINQIP